MSNVGARIRQARALARLTQTAVAEAAGVAQGTIAKYERGTLVPDGSVLAGIATATGMPPEFFTDRPDLEAAGASTIRFREHSGMSAQDRDRAQALGDIAYELLMRNSEGLKLPRVALPDKRYTDVAAAAQDTREALGFAHDEPIGHLARAAERAGVRLFQVPAEGPQTTPRKHFRSIQAFSYWAGPDLDQPVAMLYRADAGDRVRWSLSHELGHLVLHTRLLDEERAEAEANAFAAEFLLPAVSFLSDLGTTVTLAGLLELKRSWRVSVAAMIMRAHQLDAIDDQRKKALFMQLSRRGWRLKEPAPIPAERPRLLRQLLERVYGDPPDVSVIARREHLPQTLVAALIHEQDTGPRENSDGNRASVTSLDEKRKRA